MGTTLNAMTTALAAPRIPGWFNHGQKILSLIEQYRPKVCVELGTWQGASAVPIAMSIKRWGGTLTCIDTWSGELDENGGSKEGKPPVMLFTCARRIVEAGIAEHVRFIPGMTSAAAKVWSGLIDFLYVDADHSYKGVSDDLDAWYPHVRKGGLIVGDDYDNAMYPGVKQAWDDFEVLYSLDLQHYQSDPPLTQGIQLVYGVKP